MRKLCYNQDQLFKNVIGKYSEKEQDCKKILLSVLTIFLVKTHRVRQSIFRVTKNFWTDFSHMLHFQID